MTPKIFYYEIEKPNEKQKQFAFRHNQCPFCFEVIELFLIPMPLNKAIVEIRECPKCSAYSIPRSHIIN